MESKDFKLTLPEGTKEIRFGDLPKLPEYRKRVSYEFKGNIRAPWDYFSKKYALSRHRQSDTVVSIPESTMVMPANTGGEPLVPFDKFDMLVEVDIAKLTLKFIEDNHTSNGSAVIIGKLEVSPEIKELGINDGRIYTAKELSELLKMRRIMFADRDQNLTLVKSLQAFKAKVEQDIEQANDNKGNKKYVFDQSITQTNDLKFTLNWPILSGEPKVKFEVEINYDVRNSAIVFWLESVEMHESHMMACEALFTEEIAKFTEATVPVVRT